MAKGKSSISNSTKHIAADEEPSISILQNAQGKVPYNMTNDYMFRAVLQSNESALRGLICSLLHLQNEQVRSASILNAVELGNAIVSKDFLLDVKVLLNDNTVINLEMQVINEHNWIERSLSYLCRAFDNLEKGQSYATVKTAIQIGFLDFALFPEHPEFYATYQMRNVKNHLLYSDKLRLSVVDLSHIHLATAEDRLYQIDAWAALFQSTTWEEIKMLAQTNESIKEASVTIYKLTQEEKIRMQCEAREDYYRRQKDVELYMANLKAELKSAKAELKSTKAELKSTKTELERSRAKSEGNKAESEGNKAELERDKIKTKSALAEKDALIAALREEIERLKAGG